MSEGEDLDIHLQKTCCIYQDLRVAGDGLLESKFLMLLFCSLPPSWETFIASIDFTDVNNDDEKIKNKAVASILVHLQVKGTQWKSLNPTPSSSSAFNSQGAFHSQGSNPSSHWKPNKSNTECKYCHKKDIGYMNARNIFLMRKGRMLMLPLKKEMILKMHSLVQPLNSGMLGLATLWQIITLYMIAIHLLNIIPCWVSLSRVLVVSKPLSMVSD